MDLIFVYFTMLEALFNFPRWMNVWFPSIAEYQSVHCLPDLIQLLGGCKEDIIALDLLS